MPMMEGPQQTADPVGALTQAVESVKDARTFAALLKERPALFGEDALTALRGLVEVPGLGKAMTPFLELVEEAPRDHELAWSNFEEAMTIRAAEEEQFAQLYRESEDLWTAGRNDEAIALAGAALARTDEEGHWVWSAEFHAAIATSLRTRRGDIAADIEEAIEHMALAVRGAAMPAIRTDREINLAALYGIRRKGDPEENFEKALAILESARARLESETPPRLRVLLLNNLMRAYAARERGERGANLTRSLEVGREALTITSRTEDPEGWALIRINLGETLRALDAEQGGRIAEAEGFFGEVAGLRASAETDTFAGTASGALGEIHLERARRIAEESGRVGLGAAPRRPPAEAERAELKAAERHLEAAVKLIDAGRHGWQLGHFQDELAQTYGLSEEPDREIAAYRRAIEVEQENAAPALVRRSGFALGLRLADRGEWTEAAEAFALAIEAGQSGLDARLGNRARREEMRKAGNLSRWGAYAMARSGDPEGAMLALENGRARDIRRRLGIGIDEDSLGSLPGDARESYRAALERLAGSAAGEDADSAARELQKVIAWIREIPGHERFASSVDLETIAAAVEPGRPVVYVDPTPWGVMVLSLEIDAGGERTDASFSEVVNSEDLVIELMIGDRSDPRPRLSYVAMASGGEGTPLERREAVEQACFSVGKIAELVGRHLEATAAKGATLILCGPVSQTPLQAATWPEDGETICLLDRYAIRTAPSAGLQAICLRRAHQRQGAGHSLLAMGNPELDLPGSEEEVRSLGARFPDAQKNVALRSEATVDRLVEGVPTATHIHLACHAEGGLLGQREAKLDLADGSLSGEELERLPVEANLTVLSACQTGLADMADLLDEAAAMSTALLIAGSASVVATLWPVSDRSTSLLMTRFYDGVFDQRLTPSEALRRAQLSLRDEPGSKFAHPFHWAAFVLAGA